jgi:hypothetical protein
MIAPKLFLLRNLVISEQASEQAMPGLHHGIMHLDLGRSERPIPDPQACATCPRLNLQKSFRASSRLFLVSLRNEFAVTATV